MAGENDLKHWFSKATVKEIAQLLHSAEPSFKRRRFVTRASRGLEHLELKARVVQIAEALHSILPAPSESEFRAATDLFGRALDSSSTDTDAATEQIFVWPFCSYVELYGTAYPQAALDAIYVLTRHFSCEFAIRPFITSHPELVRLHLKRWLRDKNPHVRRLVSEGTRPRLPWATRLAELVRDPGPNLPLLDALFADESLYVRRSVANHLGDIAKDHVELAVGTAKRWLEQHDSEETRWVVRHALRGPLKAGHTGALALLGYQTPRISGLKLRLSDRTVRFGDGLGVVLELNSTAAQELMIDYAVHYQKKDGTLSPKVFKWWRGKTSKGQRLRMEKVHPLKPITTRRFYSGEHAVEVFVNGQSLKRSPFRLVGVKPA